MALFAIGDVHGCARSLEALLDKLGPSREDELVFVGDYVDRGPRSRQALDLAVSLEQAGASARGPRCVFLRGNHDQMMLDWADHGEIDLWRTNGGLVTLQSYASPDGRIDIPDEHLAFLRRTRLYYDIPGFCFVHAGLDPEISVAENLRLRTAETFLWSRSHFGRPRRWEKTVVCGHTPHPQPLLEPDLIGIDTGCCFPHLPGLGRLSAIQLPERLITQVDNQE